MTERSTQSRRARYALAGAVASSLLAASFFPSAATATPTAAPTLSPAVTAAAKPAPQENTIPLPDGLKPAHESVFWENSEACASFSFDTLERFDEEPVEYTNASSPVLGCSEDFVAFYNKSDEYYIQLSQDEIDGSYEGVMFAAWDGSRWILLSDYDGAWSYPQLRVFSNASGAALEEEMSSQLQPQGVWVSNIEHLVGPDAAIWTSNVPAESWERQELPGQPGVTAEIRDDWKIYANRWFDDSPDMITDRFGNFHLSLDYTTSTDEAPGECYLADSTYRIKKASSTEMTANGQQLNVAIVELAELGQISYRIMLVPESASKSGLLCDIDQWLSVGSSGYLKPMIKGNFRFVSQKEINAFTKSVAWKDIVRFAGSLQFS